MNPNVHHILSAAEDRGNSPNIQHGEAAENPSSEDLSKELGSSSVPKMPSTDAARPDATQSSGETNDSATRSPPQFQRYHYLDIPGKSGAQETLSLRREETWCI
ncbi:hypothetical protein TNCV_1603821 [Trichonephila clavipes]|nr:hypothetical protein TNCV_1603821 [Trichonephila clavipes]